MTRQEKITLSFAVVVGLVLLGLMGLTLQHFMNKRQFNPSTACEIQPLTRTDHLIMVDNSEAMPEAQAKLIEHHIDQYLKVLKTGDKVYFVAFSNPSDGQGIHPVLLGRPMCAPDSGETANVWIENPAFIKARYQAYLSQYKQALSTVTHETQGRPQSPLLELFPLAHKLYLKGQRETQDPNAYGMKVVLFSDLMQHDQNVSFYRRGEITRPLQLRKIDGLPHLEVKLYQVLSNAQAKQVKYQKARKIWNEVWLKNSHPNSITY